MTEDEQKKLDILTRKSYAMQNKETIVFALDQDQYGNWIVVTLENPYMLMAADTKEKAIKNAFKAYEVYLDNLNKIVDNSGDTEVSQLTTSKT
jgi:hypothetical protein